MNTYYKKKALRSQIREKRAAITEADRQTKSEEILYKLTSLEEYKKADIILTYVSLRYEVDSFAFIEAAVKAGKKVAVPRCIEGSPTIDFYYITGKNDLEKGSFGILEPKAETEKLCTSKKGFCVLPGLSFDRFGTRLGYGKGYYDRFLQSFRGTTVGVCFSDVLSETAIPKGRFDVPANIIVTEKEIIRVKKFAPAVPRHDNC